MNELIKLNEQTVKTYNDFDVVFTDDAYVSVTPIAKKFNKKTADYLKLAKTQEYIKALVQKLSMERNPVTEETLVFIVQSGVPQTHTHVYRDSADTQHAKLHLKWTQKGRLFIYDLLKSKGILPICEQE